MINSVQVEEMWRSMESTLNEKQRRCYAATLANMCGYGGGTVVHNITGLSLNTITAGKREIEEKKIDRNNKSGNRVRAEGGGRKSIEKKYPKIRESIKEIIDGRTYGNPEKVLTWTTESLRKIAKTLEEKYSIKVSHMTVGEVLEEMGYSKQGNQKLLQVGEPHPDRDEQFEFIAKKAKKYIDAGIPVISVDTKKKEHIGNFKNNGQEYRETKNPRKVLDHDFPFKELGKVAPYGIYVQNNNTGYVNLGTSHDTPEFSVESISRWWNTIGRNTFQNAKEIYITCDCGGSNSYRSKLWKYQLQQFAAQSKLEIHISHFPPGTSKWNKVEHRLFCYISKNWAGQPLISVKAVINLINSTTTSTGLKVICKQDSKKYKLGVTVTDEQYKSIKLSKIGSHGDWNYIIKP